jgi:tRNA A-37 threonylcarbamoyl transferase component Bud32
MAPDDPASSAHRPAPPAPPAQGDRAAVAQEFVEAVSLRRPDAATARARVEAVSTGVGVAVLTTEPQGNASTLPGGGPPDDDRGVPDVDALVGTTLCRTYTIVRTIGEGGMGRVYEARHTRIASKRFAIKTLHPEYLRQPDVLARFQREAEAAASINEPHVVGVYDVDRTPEGRPFMVTEFLEGQDLGALLRAHGRLQLGFAVRIVRQCCKALAAAHAQGVVHRDIKPPNVFLTGDPKAPLAKVLDFGISRIAGRESTNLTKTGMIMGTPAFMAPEQARGAKTDARTDIYALGALLYTALTGREPFDAGDPQAVLVAVLTQDPPRPRAIEPSIPEHLELCVQRAMAKSPDDRFQDMVELDAALAPYDPGDPTDSDMMMVPSGRGGAWDRSGTMPIGADGGAEDRRGSMPLGAQNALARQTQRVSLARPELVLLATLASVAIVSTLVNAIGAALRVARSGRAPSGTEAALVLLCVASALFTPALMLLRHVRRHTWQNSARVMELNDRLRGPVLAGMTAYGALALLLRLVDTLVLRQPAALGWAGWDLVLGPLSFLGAGAAVWARRMPPKRSAEGARSSGALRPLWAVLAWSLVALASLVVAHTLRPPAAGAMAADRRVAVPGAPAPEPSAVDSASPGDSPDATGQPTAATAAELDAARASGRAALETLHQQYPRDLVVLKVLALELGKSSDGLQTAVALVDEIIAADAAKADDEEVGRLLVRAADGPAAGARQALEIMAQRLGKRGPDLLYEVWTGEGKRAGDAQKLLADPKVRERSTPALVIAIELRRAQGCKDKAKLLDRAAALGDERVIAILAPLTTGTPKGCGFLGLGACPAPCWKDATAMKRAMQTIRDGRKR